MPMIFREHYLGCVLVPESDFHSEGIEFVLVKYPTSESLFYDQASAIQSQYHDPTCHGVHPSSEGDRCKPYPRKTAMPISEFVFAPSVRLNKFPAMPHIIGNKKMVEHVAADASITTSASCYPIKIGSQVHLPPSQLSVVDSILDLDSPEQQGGANQGPRDTNLLVLNFSVPEVVPEMGNLKLLEDGVEVLDDVCYMSPVLAKVKSSTQCDGEVEEGTDLGVQMVTTRAKSKGKCDDSKVVAPDPKLKVYKKASISKEKVPLPKMSKGRGMSKPDMESTRLPDVSSRIPSKSPG